MSKKRLFKGVSTALVTPFCENGIDYPSLEFLIERQIATGIDALVIGGTTGEAATLSDREKTELFKVAKSAVSGRCKLIFGTGSNDTNHAVALTKQAAKIGADGVLAVTPYYNKGTEDGILQHFQKIATASDLPVLLYEVPSRTGVTFTERQLETLARSDRIVGIKEAGDSVDRLVMLSCFGDDLPLYAGNDSQVLSVLALGGDGVVSVLSNLLPEVMKKLTVLFDENRIFESICLQKEIYPLTRAIFCETNPAPIKYLLARSGLCGESLRLPLSPPSKGSKAKLDAAFAGYIGC